MATEPDSAPSRASVDTDIDSLPSSPTVSSASSRDDSDADHEWRESLQQIELLLTLVAIPYLGKYFGRRCAYWGWGKFMEWRYPVTVEITRPGAFRGAGLVETAASL